MTEVDGMTIKGPFIPIINRLVEKLLKKKLGIRVDSFLDSINVVTFEGKTKITVSGSMVIDNYVVASLVEEIK